MDTKALSKSYGKSVKRPSSRSIHVVGQDVLDDQQSLHSLESDLREEVDDS